MKREECLFLRSVLRILLKVISNAATEDKHARPRHRKGQCNRANVEQSPQPLHRTQLEVTQVTRVNEKVTCHVTI